VLSASRPGFQTASRFALQSRRAVFQHASLCAQASEKSDNFRPGQITSICAGFLVLRGFELLAIADLHGIKAVRHGLATGVFAEAISVVLKGRP
jgi:hypothetical protein